MGVDEWDRRMMCSDGSCIGVIGADGLCKVCGRAAPNWGDERRRGMIAADDDEAKAAKLDEDEDEGDEDDDGEDDEDDDGDDEDDEDDEDEDEGDDDGVAETAAQATSSTSGDDTNKSSSSGDDTAAYEWSRRKLCSDGACVGVIGADGTCKVCGRSPG